MRLKEMHKIMIENKEPINKALGRPLSNDGYVHVENYSELLSALSKISKTKLIDNEMDDFEEKLFLVIESEKALRFSDERYQQFSNILSRIKIKIETIDTLVNNLYSNKEEQNDSLVVSMPDRLMTLSELMSISDKLDEIFKMLSKFDEFNYEDIKLVDFDKGSNWLVILIGSSSALLLFGKLVLVVQQIKLNALNEKFLKEQYNKLGLEQDAQQEFLDTARKISLNIYRENAKSVIESNNLDNSEENLTSLSMAMEHIHKLNEMGVAFKAGINSSIETAKSFPPIEQQKELDVTKQIDQVLNLPKDEED